jgi:hypothetical protein
MSTHCCNNSCSFSATGGGGFVRYSVSGVEGAAAVAMAVVAVFFAGLDFLSTS